MKRKLMPYLLSYAFLFVSYLIISFIMAILFSFMHVSSFVYNILLIIMNYFLLSVFTLFFFKNVKEKPTVIIAKTIKGKGVSFMENKAEWHGKAPNKEQYEQAMKELE